MNSPMFRLSSNTTVIWKLFVPTFYITFFGLLVLAAFLSNSSDLPMLTSLPSKIILSSSYLIFIGLMWFTIMNLKRVEADDDAIYVSNYFKSYRYLKEDIDHISEANYLIFKITTIHMKSTTKMGKRIRFIGEYHMLRK